MVEQQHSRSQKTAFVTGATGFLGQNLIEQLVAGGWHVHALHRATSDLGPLARFGVDLVEGTIDDEGSLERAMPEGVVVFHLAADVSFWSGHKHRQTKTNVDGTRNVVAAALRRKARKMIHTSTTSVYGFSPPGFDETTPHRGRDSWFHYMHTKVLAEDEVRKGISKGLDAVFINPGNIIGRYDRHNWSRLIRLAAENKLPRVPPGRGSFCHSVEVARAHLAAVEHGRTGENYIVGGADASYVDVVRTVGELLGRKVNTRAVPPVLLKISGRLLGWLSLFTRREPFVTPESAAFLSADLTCKSDRAVRELGYQPVSLRVMLEDCYQWMKRVGMLKE